MPIKLNLNLVVRDVLDETDLVEPRDVADYIVTDVLDEDEFEDALRLTLPQYVREVIRSKRSSFRQTHSGKQASAKASSGTRKARSRKMASILDQRIFVGDRWVMLGQATPADIRAVIADYKRRATEERAMAKRYEQLLALFSEHKANRVSDLPIAKVEEALA